jgi:uncharacterized protein YggU (UPF0235/DUF167 family)
MLVKVKVFPNSKKEEVEKKKEDSFIVRVKEKPVEGMASKAAVKVLSLFLNVPINKIRIVKGLKTRNKIFEIKE